MAYEPTAAAISQAAEICSPRTRAITPHATAPTTATSVQMTIERARDFVLTSCLPLRCGLPHPAERGAKAEVGRQVGAESTHSQHAPAVDGHVTARQVRHRHAVREDARPLLARERPVPPLVLDA